MSGGAREKDTHYGGPKKLIRFIRKLLLRGFGVADYRFSFRFKKFKMALQYGGQVNLINFY